MASTLPTTAAAITAVHARSSLRVTSVMALYGMRMPRVNASLPEDLYRALTDRNLSPSQLLQDAIRRHVDDVDRRAVLDELLESYPGAGDDSDENGKWRIWADETLAEHLERRVP
jgi:hypothetical protein